MKVEKKPLDNGHVLLEVSASAEEVDQAFGKGLEFYLEQMGMRSAQGATPEEKIINAFADRAPEVMVEAVMDYFLPFALREAKENPIVAPKSTPEGSPQKGQPFKMTVDVFSKPQFELSSYEPVEITVMGDAVTEQDIDEQIKMLAEKQGASASDVNDEWVAAQVPDADVNTVEELRAKLRKASKNYRADEAESKNMEIALRALTERLEGDIPAAVLDATVDSMIEDLKMQLMYQGMTFETYLTNAKTDEDQLQKDAAAQARGNLSRGFALDAIFRHAGLTLSDDDITEALSVMAPGNEKEMREKLEETGRLFMLEESAERMKAGKWVLENAKITVL